MSARYLRLRRAGFAHEVAAELALAGYDVLGWLPVGRLPAAAP